MRLTRVVPTVVLALLSAAGSFGARGLQKPTTVTADCPVVDVSCPDASKPGEPLTFIANISGGDPEVTPTFKWTVSGGTIASGQGTSSITVNTSGPVGLSVTATVEVGGYVRECDMSDSCTLMPGLPPTSRKVDEYGDVTAGNEKARLDNFAIELQNDPTARGYLICYGGRRGPRGAARRRCDRAKNFLVASRGVDSRRLVAFDGGYREFLTVEAWIVPPGAAPPPPAPTVFPRGRERR